MDLSLGSRSAQDYANTRRKCQKKNKKTATTKVEQARGCLLLKQVRSEHHCRCHLLRELRYFFNRRELIDVEPGEYEQHALLRRKMNRLLRHDRSVLREEDGAVEFKIMAPMFVSQFESSPHWSLRTWPRYLQRGGGPKKRFQYCLDPYSVDTFFYLRTSQGHSGGNPNDPELQDNVMLPRDFAEYIHHGGSGSSHDMHSIILSGVIPGGPMSKEGDRRYILHSRGSHVRASTQTAGLRRD